MICLDEIFHLAPFLGCLNKCSIFLYNTASLPLGGRALLPESVSVLLLVDLGHHFAKFLKILKVAPESARRDEHFGLLFAV